MMKRILLLLALAVASCAGKKDVGDVFVRVISSGFIYETDSIPSCHASTLVETGDGLRLLVCNPLQKDRNKLALLGSYDGTHWRTLLVLEDWPSGEFSYPAIIALSDGTIGITYTHNRTRIRFVHLSVSSHGRA